MLKYKYLSTNFIKTMVDSDFIFLESDSKYFYTKILDYFHLNSDLKNLIKTIFFLQNEIGIKKKKIYIVVEDPFALEIISLMFKNHKSHLLIEVKPIKFLTETIALSSSFFLVVADSVTNRSFKKLFSLRKFLINQINFNSKKKALQPLGIYSINNSLDKNNLKKILFLMLLIKNLTHKKS
jgi:hypothetical protein